jgi:hypothetical protein
VTRCETAVDLLITQRFKSCPRYYETPDERPDLEVEIRPLIVSLREWRVVGRRDEKRQRVRG